METDAKRRSTLWAVILVGAFWGALWAGPIPAHAQKPPAVTSAAIPADQDMSIIDAQRGALDRFLDVHPEIEGTVVGQPALMSNQKFLDFNPELKAFLESHPQVKANPRAFLRPAAQSRRWQIDRLLSDMVTASVFICFLLAFLWVLRTLVENRRWNRSFKMHEDLHTKLIEKFASGQDFSAYMQSDAGRRLLEWTPPALDTTSRSLPNPLGRIFWSLQAGLVLLLVGLGLLLLRGQMAEGYATPLLVFGTLDVTLGTGFILSAVLSYGLSKHLGLISGAARGSDATLKS